MQNTIWILHNKADIYQLFVHKWTRYSEQVLVCTDAILIVCNNP